MHGNFGVAVIATDVMLAVVGERNGVKVGSWVVAETTVAVSAEAGVRDDSDVAVRSAEMVSYSEVGLGKELGSEEAGTLHPINIVKLANITGMYDFLIIASIQSAPILPYFTIRVRLFFLKAFSEKFRTNKVE